MAWQLSGQYFETCSCDVLCPCITSQATAMPTLGHCDAVLAFHIERGASDGVDLAGLTAVIALQADGPMANGQGRREIYLDSAASEPQRAALETIFSGQAGGPPEAVGGLVPELLGVHSARIEFGVDGETRTLKVDGFGEQSVSGLPGFGGVTMQITNAGHPAANDLALARAGATASFHDAAFNFNNAGKNGHYAAFSWQA
ncbi:MAG TPA: DUF1326 domain-containing protein [Dehalococcoidia bacterium]|nr:DUF1326 domain-containing protein [Dehalococcoidia bacterium]